MTLRLFLKAGGSALLLTALTEVLGFALLSEATTQRYKTPPHTEEMENSNLNSYLLGRKKNILLASPLQEQGLAGYITTWGTVCVILWELCPVRRPEAVVRPRAQQGALLLAR